MHVLSYLTSTRYFAAARAACPAFERLACAAARILEGCCGLPLLRRVWEVNRTFEFNGTVYDALQAQKLEGVPAFRFRSLRYARLGAYSLDRAALLPWFLHAARDAERSLVCEAFDGAGWTALSEAKLVKGTLDANYYPLIASVVQANPNVYVQWSHWADIDEVRAAARRVHLGRRPFRDRRQSLLSRTRSPESGSTRRSAISMRGSAQSCCAIICARWKRSTRGSAST